MNTETRRYHVVIHDKEYNIVSDESEEHVVKAAAMVHDTMQAMVPGSHQVDKQQLAVLSALQMASKVLQLEEQLDQYKKREIALVEWTENKLAAL